MKELLIFLGIIALVAAGLMFNKKFVETIKNIWKIEDLRKRIIYTLALLLIYRLGSFVVIPGINPNALGAGSGIADQVEGNGLLGLLNIFTGGAFSNASILALGVMPYITASIVMQLLTIAIPALERMQKSGPEGQKKIAQITRYVTIALAALQAMVNPGDEVMYLEPGWVSYPSIIEASAAKPVPVRLTWEQDFRVSKEILDAHCTDKTKMLIINYPNNPTGAIMTKEELEEIQWSVGAEYVYHDQFSLRAGYHHESENKGNRKY